MNLRVVSYQQSVSGIGRFAGCCWAPVKQLSFGVFDSMNGDWCGLGFGIFCRSQVGALNVSSSSVNRSKRLLACAKQAIKRLIFSMRLHVLDKGWIVLHQRAANQTIDWLETFACSTQRRRQVASGRIIDRRRFGAWYRVEHRIDHNIWHDQCRRCGMRGRATVGADLATVIFAEVFLCRMLRQPGWQRRGRHRRRRRLQPRTRRRQRHRQHRRRS